LDYDHDYKRVPELASLEPGPGAERLEACIDGIERTVPYWILTLGVTGLLFVSLWMGGALAEKFENVLLGFFPAGFVCVLSMILYYFGRLFLIRREARKRAGGRGE
jgi:hypothetical protein